jgi:hypothetical protein
MEDKDVPGDTKTEVGHASKTSSGNILMGKFLWMTTKHIHKHEKPRKNETHRRIKERIRGREIPSMINSVNQQNTKMN